MKRKTNISIFRYACCCYFLTVLMTLAPMKFAWAEEAFGDKQAGFLVLAADRGFLGNEEIIDEFQLFAKERNATLVFVTDERTQNRLEKGVERLLQNQAERIVVIPLFMSSSDPRYELAQRLLQRRKTAIPLSYARPYGSSIFAVEALAEKLRTIQSPTNTSLVIVGYGAVDNDSKQRMLADWKRIAEKAATGFGFSSVNAMVGYDYKDDAEEQTASLKQELVEVAENKASQGKVIVVPFHLGPKLDSMMSFNAKLKWLLPPGAQLVSKDNPDMRLDNRAGDSEDAPMITGRLATWLQREANLNQALSVEDTGVVFLSHGSDFHWNETMRDAVQPLSKRYKIEFAFSMADQVTIERAIRKLEQRGAKAAIIVRVFAMEDSFRASIERMMGLDVEDIVQNAAATHTEHGHGHGEAAGVPAPRILTSLPTRTTGGMGSNPLFAAALLDRAFTASKNPARDTIILVAHGSGNDHQNDRWTKVLEEIAAHMRNSSGNKFHAIKVAYLARRLA